MPHLGGICCLFIKGEEKILFYPKDKEAGLQSNITSYPRL